MEPNKFYFQRKGRIAEVTVKNLATKTFLVDWCFPNPKLPDGKELCDLLIVFDDIAIIWMVKHLKLGLGGRYKQQEVEKNIRQLLGARRQLMELKKPFKLRNSRRTLEPFDPTSIKKIYLVAALMGRRETISSPIEERDGKVIHIFNRGFTKLVLKELDTISDFCAYLGEKERFFKTGKRMFIEGGEEDLLALYLLNGRSFKRFEEADFITLTGENWKYISQKQEYKDKKREDGISYAWDKLVESAHSSNSTEYELIARELARPNRFERRVLSKSFLEAALIANSKGEKETFRRVLPTVKGITYCFLFHDDPEPRTERKAHLAALCFIARDEFIQNTRVIGVATERKFGPRCSYDFCLLEKLNWSEEDKKNALDLRKKTGILTNTKYRKIHEEEYPDMKGS